MASSLSSPISLKVIQAVGLTSTFVLAGTIGSVSVWTVPGLASTPPSTKTQIWRTVYNMGKVSAPPVALVAALSWGYLASKVNSDSSAFTLLTIAAVLTPGIVPYTLLVMKPTNDALMHKADVLSASGTTGVDPEVDTLLARWKTLNLIRSLIVGAGGIAGTWALLDAPLFY